MEKKRSNNVFVFVTGWSCRRTLPACRASSSPVSIKSSCSPSAGRVALQQKAPASSRLPAPPSRPRVSNPSLVLEKWVRHLQPYIFESSKILKRVQMIDWFLRLLHTFYTFSMCALCWPVTENMMHFLKISCKFIFIYFILNIFSCSSSWTLVTGVASSQ